KRVGERLLAGYGALMHTLVNRTKIIGLLAVVAMGLLPLPASASIGSCGGSVSPSSISPGTDTVLDVQVINFSGPTMEWLRIARPNADYTISSATLSGWSASVNA